LSDNKTNNLFQKLLLGIGLFTSKQHLHYEASSSVDNLQNEVLLLSLAQHPIKLVVLMEFHQIHEK
jgi:hypothetical protein